MEIRLTEKFLLIAQSPEKGRFLISSLQLNVGLVGAILMEMTFDKKIVIEQNKLLLKSSKSSNDPVLSEITGVIKKSKKPRKVKYWVSKLERKVRRYKWIFLEKMQKDRLVRIEHKKFLGAISYRKCFLINKRIRDDILKQLKDAVFYKKELSEENIVLLGLVEACGLQKTLASDRKELKVVKKRLKELLKEEPIAQAVGKTLAEMQAALSGAISAAIVTS